MARDTLTLQEIGGEGSQFDDSITFTNIVAANDMQFDNTSGDVLLVVSNGDASSQDFTLVDVADPYGRQNASTDLTRTVAAGEIGIYGPFTPSIWNQTGGYVHIDSADETSFGFAAVKFTRR